MKNKQQHEPNVMAANAMIASHVIQTANANEVVINAKLQRRLAFLDLEAVEMGPLHQDNEVAPFIKVAEERRKAKADKRLHAKLRKMEVEQKEVLLAEAQKSMEEARRKFESQTQVPYDYPQGPPTCIEDIFREENARNELRVLEPGLSDSGGSIMLKVAGTGL
jgi:hypothetical protein